MRQFKGGDFFWHLVDDRMGVWQVGGAEVSGKLELRHGAAQGPQGADCFRSCRTIAPTAICSVGIGCAAP